MDAAQFRIHNSQFHHIASCSTRTFRLNFSHVDILIVALLSLALGAAVGALWSTSRARAAHEAALQEKMKVKSALFHEGLPLIQRDRNAAWFAEPDGAQLLICSEIGSEGRNFQFAHHLILFDLPLNPGLLEQRIGRVHRFGQNQPVSVMNTKGAP